MALETARPCCLPGCHLPPSQCCPGGHQQRGGWEQNWNESVPPATASGLAAFWPWGTRPRCNLDRRYPLDFMLQEPTSLGLTLPASAPLGRYISPKAAVQKSLGLPCSAPPFFHLTFPFFLLFLSPFPPHLYSVLINTFPPFYLRSPEHETRSLEFAAMSKWQPAPSLPLPNAPVPRINPFPYI